MNENEIVHLEETCLSAHKQHHLWNALSRLIRDRDLIETPSYIPDLKAATVSYNLSRLKFWLANSNNKIIFSSKTQLKQFVNDFFKHHVAIKYKKFIKLLTSINVIYFCLARLTDGVLGNSLARIDMMAQLSNIVWLILVKLNKNAIIQTIDDKIINTENYSRNYRDRIRPEYHLGYLLWPHIHEAEKRIREQIAQSHLNAENNNDFDNQRESFDSVNHEDTIPLLPSIH